MLATTMMLQAPDSDSCALARFKMCALGEPLCPALTLGLGATPDQAAFGRVYNTGNCQGNSVLEIELVFAGERLAQGSGCRVQGLGFQYSCYLCRF